MNYIKLLNAAYQKLFEDDRLQATHMSLYMVLFQEWNGSRFSDSFFINRWEIMQASKIGSKSTYSRCLKDLDAWGYIRYSPSYNRFKGSAISMTVFYQDMTSDDSYDPVLEKLAKEYSCDSVTSEIIRPHKGLDRYNEGSEIEPQEERIRAGTELQAVPFINITKQANKDKWPNDKQAVEIFFKMEGSKISEAEKFWNYYQKRRWKTNNGVSIKDWQAIARSWIERNFSSNLEQKSQGSDHLKTRKSKAYDQPL